MPRSRRRQHATWPLPTRTPIRTHGFAKHRPKHTRPECRSVRNKRPSTAVVKREPPRPPCINVVCCRDQQVQCRCEINAHLCVCCRCGLMTNIELWGTGGCGLRKSAFVDGRLFRTDRTRCCHVVPHCNVCCPVQDVWGVSCRGVGSARKVEHPAGAVHGRRTHTHTHTPVHIFNATQQTRHARACMPRTVARAEGRVVLCA